MTRRFLIVAGAEKAGTTSLYTYLAAHPGVCASLKKELDYFREPVADLDKYLAHFDGGAGTDRVCLESSPAYMAEAVAVAPRIAALLPQARLVFLLRDPIDRLKSSFRFYKSRLHLPEAMTFDDFVDRCFQYQEGGRSAAEVGYKDWFLKSLQRGRYEQQLDVFSRHFQPSQMMMVLYDDLRDDVAGTTQRVARFAGLDDGFFSTYQFGRDNVTFYAKGRALHRLALAVNNGFEKVWRRHPALKKRLLALYKRMNEKPIDPDAAHPDTVKRLKQFYAPTFAFMASQRLPAAGAPAAKAVMPGGLTA